MQPGQPTGAEQRAMASGSMTYSGDPPWETRGRLSLTDVGRALREREEAER